MIDEKVKISPRSPWAEVVVVSTPGAGAIEPRERVAWSVAMHRALVSVLGDDAASDITGVYPRGAAIPANRVAIQPLDVSLMAAADLRELGSGFALLAPEAGAESVSIALSRLRRVYRQKSAIELGEVTAHTASEFWQQCPPDMTRLWRSGSAVVPEIRRPKSLGNRQWTLADSTLLSVGFAFRDVLKLDAKLDGKPASERYRTIVDEVRDRGVRVLSTSSIADSNAGLYAHKMPNGVVAQPYHVTLNGGSLIPERALVAIGQSRHLGGGLLCPVDMPESVAATWEE